MTIYYHNPKCSKSRSGLELLENSGIDFTIKEYLKEPMSEAELENLFKKLGKPGQDVIRTKEDLYTELNLAQKSLSDKEWAQVLVENPKLLERPILVTDTRAVIGRPTEELKKLI